MIRRREFITLFGGAAAAWPVGARGQQATLPVVGWLGSGSPDAYAGQVAAFRKGVSETGFVEGKNVTIEYRWAEGQYDRLPALAADLIRLQAAVILTSGGTRPTLAVKAATSAIPIVFLSGGNDPVAAGLVASFNRPGGNVTGVSFLANNLVTKQLGLLRELVPAATIIALLMNPDTPATDPMVNDAQKAADVLKLKLRVLTAGTERDIDDAFASFGQRLAHALVVQTDPFLSGRLIQIASLAARYAIPTIYSSRNFVLAGGLISYGASNRDAYRQGGVYVGRILKGERPADMPVVQPTKFELLINLKTAKALGLTFPNTLLVVADEVIE